MGFLLGMRHWREESIRGECQVQAIPETENIRNWPLFWSLLELVRSFAGSDGRYAIDRCHGPNRKLREPLLSDARRALFQVQGPGPIGLEQTGGRRPINVLHVGERMRGRQGRAVGGAIHQRFEFVDGWQPPGTARAFLVKRGHRCQCLAPDHRLRCELRAAAPDQAGKTIQYAGVKYFKTRFWPRSAVTQFAVLTGAGACDDFAGGVIAQALARARQNVQTFAAPRP